MLEATHTATAQAEALSIERDSIAKLQAVIVEHRKNAHDKQAALQMQLDAEVIRANAAHQRAHQAEQVSPVLVVMTCHPQIVS